MNKVSAGFTPLTLTLAVRKNIKLAFNVVQHLKGKKKNYYSKKKTPKPFLN